ncbi:MAG: redoxin family protein [Candidatus Taylorbacteria bacterium]
MKLEYKIAIIIGGALVVGGAIYLFSPKQDSSSYYPVGIPKGIPNEGIATEIISGESTSTSTKGADSNQKNTVAEKKIISDFKNAHFALAPELSTIDGYINTGGKPITLTELRGKKVVLLDIWTYSCINCQRTLPFIEEWYDKYKDQGLEIIGLHTPEFSFEKVEDNVTEAVKKLGIIYPVVLDNDFSTWKAYGNQYWPRKYLIDIDGYIVYDHIGEGGYEETEMAIRSALLERANRLGVNMDVVPSEGSAKESTAISDLHKVGSPETYFGSERNQYLANGTQGRVGLQTLSIPSIVNANTLYLSGTWNFTPEFAENESEAKIIFKYSAKNVYMVAGSDTGVDVEIFLDGVLSKTILIKGVELYTLFEGSDYGVHTLEIRIKKSRLKAFTFTFG